MTVSTTPTLATLLQGFFVKYLINQRNVSHRTVESYRDTFRILLHYFKEHLGKDPSHLDLQDVTPQNIEAFLQHLEKERSNTARTRNNRFAAIRSFLKYVSVCDPASSRLSQKVLAMPMKRFNRPLLGYLQKNEIQTILDAPDCSTWTGRRDHAMFATLYNTGARVSELVALRVEDVAFDQSVSIRLHGKGRKERAVPLWKDTAKQLKRWINEINSGSQCPLFPNAAGDSLSRAGVEYRLKRAVASAAQHLPSLKHRRISPHTLRHTTAMHLLQSGVDITVIALWLGHENPSTTHTYIEADMKMKENALAKLIEPKIHRDHYHVGDKLLRFLEGL